MLDFPARTIQTQSAPENAGTKHLGLILAFFETAAKGRSISTHRKNEITFSQGDTADAVFYIKKGKVKVTVVSQHPEFVDIEAA